MGARTLFGIANERGCWMSRGDGPAAVSGEEWKSQLAPRLGYSLGLTVNSYRLYPWGSFSSG